MYLQGFPIDSYTLIYGNKKIGVRFEIRTGDRLLLSVYGWGGGDIFKNSGAVICVPPMIQTSSPQNSKLETLTMRVN